MSATWIVERTVSRRFPFRISIEQGGRLILAVRAQARWSGPGQQIFCLRERELDPAEPLERVERVPVTHLARIGRKIVVALDRAHQKRCEFLTVHKPRPGGVCWISSARRVGSSGPGRGPRWASRYLP